MRVLLLHNRYRMPGGEERAVNELRTLLSARGHTVGVLERSSESVERRQAARGMLAGGVDPGEIRVAVKRIGADVVHAHNLHPLLGWRALAAAQAAGAKTILHLHNFRLFCAIAIAYRDGERCFRCRGGKTLPGLRLRCRGSVGEAAVYAAGLRAQLPRLLEHSDRLVAVSEATGRRLADLGVPGERLATLPNFVARGRFATGTRAADGRYALAVGRLVEEKGFDIAISACRAAGVPLVIAGEGPASGRLRELAVGSEVRFTGRLDEHELEEVRAGAAMVLAPSRWEEPCPYSVLDAMAAGVPALVSDLGGLPEMVAPAEALPARDLQRWTAAVAELWQDPELRAERGAAALTTARKRFDEELYYRRLIDLYR